MSSSFHGRAPSISRWISRKPKTLSRPCRDFNSSSARLAVKQPFDILFCGSDSFSIASLKAVLDAKELWRSVHVLLPRDRRIGRGKSGETYVPSLRTFAEERSVPFTTLPPDGINSYIPPSPFTQPTSSNLLLTASFGHIIPNSILSPFQPLHRLNVHPSLLPRYRGPAPIQWTIANGDSETGVTVQTLVEKGKGIDGGDIVGSVGGIPVPSDSTYSSMLPILADTSGRLLVKVLRQILDDTATLTPQDRFQITKAPKITHETAKIDWTSAGSTAVKLTRLSRGISHREPLWTTLSDTPIQLLSIQPNPATNVPEVLLSMNHAAGTAYIDKIEGTKKKRLLIACVSDSEGGGEEKHGWIEVWKVQVAARKEVEVGEWWNGLPNEQRKRGWIRFQ